MSTTLFNEAPFSIRLVTADSYLAAPIPDLDVTFSEFRGSEVKQVPVIRIFGSTLSGEKACLHVHGVFPYIYVPCTIEQNIDGFAYRLASSLDNAINTSLGNTKSNRQHVYKIQRVSGIPLYGYHEKEHQFFKIFFYNPAMVKRAANLLLHDSLLNCNLQPHEAHIPYILQFMIDYNIYGMNLINVNNVKHRRQLDSEQREVIETSNSFDSQEYLGAHILRQSMCKIEVDVQACHILNRQAIVNGLELNPGLAAIWEEERARRLEAGLQTANSQLVYPKSSNEVCLLPTENDLYQANKLAQRLCVISEIENSSASSNTSTLSYPLETTDVDNVLSASCVIDHIPSDLVTSAIRDTTRNNLAKPACIQLSAENLSDSKSNNTAAILDEEDVGLLEILEELAEENDLETDIDNDSVLGSQCFVFNEEAKSDNEDNDALNITCSDLDTLSPWELPDQPKLQKSNQDYDLKSQENKSDNRSEANDKTSFVIDQCDGTNDELDYTEIKNLYSVKYANKKIRKNTECKMISNTHSHKSAFCTNCLNHSNLDVYDTDEALSESDLFENKNMEIKYIKSFKKLYKICNDKEQSNHILIPAFDGNALDSSSDSDPESDITVAREEKRICIYKTKGHNQEDIVNVTPKKNKRSSNTSELISYKRHKTGDTTLLEKAPHNTPKKMQSLQSPRCYSPLNITITSPHRNKANDPINTGTTTPKRRKYRSILNRYKTPTHIATEEKEDNENIQNKELNEKISKTSTVDTDIGKNNVEVCKKLNFCDVPTEENTKFENNRQTMSEILSRERCDIIQHAEKPSSSRIEGASNISVTTLHPNNEINHHAHNTNIPRDEVDITRLVANEPLNIGDIELRNKDTSNVTFTQHINHRISLSNQSLSSDVFTHNLQTQSIVITTRFNPPSRKRILESMKTYGIPEHRHVKAFFGDKNDLIKDKDLISDDIQPFKSTLDKVTNINLWRRMKVNEFHPSGASIRSSDIKRTLASYNLVKIYPLIEPPTLNDVKKWLKAKTYLSKNDKIRKDNKYKNAIKNIEDEIDGDEPVCSNTNIEESRSGNQALNQDMNVNHKNRVKEDVQNSDSTQLGPSNSSLDPSLENIVKIQLLNKNKETGHGLGISYGEIDYSTKDSGSSITDNNLQNARVSIMHQYLTVLCLELHVITREDLLPDPEKDPIHALFYAIQNDVPESSDVKQLEYGAIVVDPFPESLKLKKMLSSTTTCSIFFVNDENELLSALMTLINRHDPDILIGWEIETLSWGYIIQRASHIDYSNFPTRISRIQTVSTQDNLEKDDFSDVKITGRIVLDVWRIMRPEIALLKYTFENVMYNILRERISCPSFKVLTSWWKHPGTVKRSRVIEHYTTRVLGTLRILSHLDIVGRTSEYARLLGIQFYEVFSRGSQFRVESMMLRLAKPLNYIAVSPSIQQKAHMRAPEALPLIMEPESQFYTDPLIVLDFQSLYPSMIIAYNYCYSTCLGRIEHIGQNEPFEFGAATLKVKKRTVLKLQDKINFSPCGVAFVKPEVRQGILPRMLTEILNTRLMVKESMKLHSSKNRALQRVLDSRQLGLKLISNVTYGYTSANFSGRMACIEIADSVVSKGRETLERAIKLVESTPKWGARVVYGDTDSLFILLPGKSRQEAFNIGYDIADTVTKANPPPVKLKFEKVLHPCILQTKKRYCGYMYESPEQEKPEYLAKGIETVRRDGCPAVAKVLEKTLKILFETKNMSLIKRYVVKQLDKVLHRRVSIQDLTFAREFRGMRGYKANACVPSLELTRRLMQKDPRAVPRIGERVQYVIVAGAPNEPLIKCVRTPQEVINNPGLYVNSVYYNTKVIIPPLNRCLNLIGIDVNTWYKEVSRGQVINKAIRAPVLENQKITICQFFTSTVCTVCGEHSNKEICTECMLQPNYAIIKLNEKLRWLERSFQQVNEICHSCVGRLDDPECESLDCPVFYRKARVQKDLHEMSFLRDLIDNTKNSS